MPVIQVNKDVNKGLIRIKTRLYKGLKVPECYGHLRHKSRVTLSDIVKALLQ